MTLVFGITPDLHNVLILVGIGAMAALAWMARSRPAFCSECPHCRRVKHEAEVRQRELRHDQEHKGWGWQSDTPDWLECSDKACPRNPKKK